MRYKAFRFIAASIIGFICLTLFISMLCNYLTFKNFLILGLIAMKMKKTIISHAYDGFFEFGNTNTYSKELAPNKAKKTIAKTM